MESGLPAAPLTPWAEAADVEALLRGALADADVAWSLGSFGAIAEFMRDAGESVCPLPDARMGLATARGAIALTPAADLRPFAYETGFSDGYNHAVALCLPESACAMSGRSVVTELGPDREAARAEERAAILFDLGLGLLAVDACVRTSDPEAVACLRAGVGRPVFAPGSPVGPRLVAMNPHRIFCTRIGRIEVYAPIPGPGETSPEGPHTHVLPELLRAGRTHAATTPIPDGFVPCGGMHPPHSYKDALGCRIPFDPARHAGFQALLERWGDPDLLSVKRGMTPSKAVSPRHARSARRAAEMQARLLRGEDAAERA
ncbi:DUF6925 family protein [Methylorubrum extorquens]|uniref:DUF6925 family protein n=1 Tax=Methylorubrum TaxID=2282523 RepID=UPI003F59DDC7|nr:hypothetical protein [Methylorubrum zatmanii]MCP1554573.1 hypothetical protein [Methylorubrum extorquens]MCP1579117.1 hypothetical protein [Methylorubrum extorquens]